jgi:hypothetical protein
MRRGRRWQRLVIVVLEFAQCGWWIFSGWVMWSIRGLMLEPSSPQIAYNTRFAVALLALAGINVLALIGFLVRPVGLGGLVLAASLLLNLVFSLWASVYGDNVGWLLLGGLPAAATLVLMILLRRSVRRTSA